MVIDTSALIAILFEEPEAAAVSHALDTDEVLYVGAATRAEMGIVAHRVASTDGIAVLHDLLDALGVVDVALDRELAGIAAEAHIRFGKGNHRARLNMGDCFTYAVAKRTGEPILCIGDDFSHTDVEVVRLDP